MNEPSAYRCFARCFSGCWRKKPRHEELGVDNQEQHQNEISISKEENLTESESNPVQPNPARISRHADSVVTGAPYSTLTSDQGQNTCAKPSVQNGDCIGQYGINVNETEHINCLKNGVAAGKITADRNVQEKTCYLNNLPEEIKINDHRTGDKQQYSINVYSDTSGSAVCSDKRNGSTSELAMCLPFTQPSPSANRPDSTISVKDILVEEESSTQILPECVKSTQKNIAADLGNSADTQGIQRFRKMTETETARLTSLTEKWEGVLTDEQVSEEVRDEIRSVNGQTRLVISERFSQFASLVDMAEKQLGQQKNGSGTGENAVTLSDLQGFWDMIYYQVEDVLNKFQRLDQVKDHGWDLRSITESSKLEARTRSFNSGRPSKKSVTKKPGSARPISQEEKARKIAARKRIAEAKKRMEEQKRAQAEQNSGVIGM